MSEIRRTCVVLFSGGRDSSLAAGRLSSMFDKLILVTITSPHMVGLERVEKRVEELKRYLPESSEWRVFPEASSFRLSVGKTEPSCLSCHFGYFVTAAAVAEDEAALDIACGYTSYQSHWVEQTSYAIRKLREVLSLRNLRLLTPVANLASKAEAEAELQRLGMSTQALELECLRQLPDPGLEGRELSATVDAWANRLGEQLNTSSLRLPAAARRMSIFTESAQ